MFLDFVKLRRNSIDAAVVSDYSNMRAVLGFGTALTDAVLQPSIFTRGSASALNILYNFVPECGDARDLRYHSKLQMISLFSTATASPSISILRLSTIERPDHWPTGKVNLG